MTTSNERNEAAEKLYEALHNEAPDETWEGDIKELARAALREQTRITVEQRDRLRAALEGLTPFVRVGSGPLSSDPAAQALRNAFTALAALPPEPRTPGEPS